MPTKGYFVITKHYRRNTMSTKTVPTTIDATISSSTTTPTEGFMSSVKGFCADAVSKPFGKASTWVGDAVESTSKFVYVPVDEFMDKHEYFALASNPGMMRNLFAKRAWDKIQAAKGTKTSVDVSTL